MQKITSRKLKPYIRHLLRKDFQTDTRLRSAVLVLKGQYDRVLKKPGSAVWKGNKKRGFETPRVYICPNFFSKTSLTCCRAFGYLAAGRKVKKVRYANTDQIQISSSKRINIVI